MTWRNAAAEWAEGSVQWGPAAVLMAASEKAAEFFVSAARDLNYWVLTVVLRPRLTITFQLLANHLQLQSCSPATPRLSYITTVVLAKRKMNAYACSLCSTTLSSQAFTACSLLIKRTGPYHSSQGNGDCNLKPYSKGLWGKQAGDFLRERKFLSPCLDLLRGDWKGVALSLSTAWEPDGVWAITVWFGLRVRHHLEQCPDCSKGYCFRKHKWQVTLYTFRAALCFSANH